MSGGHFDYWQYHIGSIAEQIEDLIQNNNKEDEYGYARNFSEETLRHFRSAVKILKTAEIYAQRVDWLVSGDDGEKTFIERLTEDLAQIKVSPLDLLVIPLPKEVKMIQVLVDRLNDYERQLKSDYGFPNKQKISHKVRELKKCIQLMQSV